MGETASKILEWTLALLKLAPTIMPQIKAFLAAIMGHVITPEEKLAIEARLDADFATYEADVDRRRAEEGTPATRAPGQS